MASQTHSVAAGVAGGRRAISSCQIGMEERLDNAVCFAISPAWHLALRERHPQGRARPAKGTGVQKCSVNISSQTME